MIIAKIKIYMVYRISFKISITKILINSNTAKFQYMFPTIPTMTVNTTNRNNTNYCHRYITTKASKNPKSQKISIEMKLLKKMCQILIYKKHNNLNVSNFKNYKMKLLICR